MHQQLNSVVIALIVVTSVGTAVSAQPGRFPQPVEVVNEPTVHSLPAPVRQPFHEDVSVLIPAGSPSATVGFFVPEGKRLIIEWFGGTTVIGGFEHIRIQLGTTASRREVFHHVAPSTIYRREAPPGVTPDFIVGFSQTVKLYADPGSFVSVSAHRSEIGEIGATFVAASLSGYLVGCDGALDCPIP